MIQAALDSSTITRLKMTRQEVDADLQQQLTLLSDFCSPVKNHGRLREFVYSHQGIVMPMAILTKDIIMLMEMQQLHCPLGCSLDAIPYLQCRSLGRLFTRSPIYHLLEETIEHDLIPMVRFLSDPVPRLSLEKLYEMSISYEPLPAHQELGGEDHQVRTTNHLHRKSRLRSSLQLPTVRITEKP